MDLHKASTSKDYDGDEPDTLNEHWNEPGDPDGVVAAERNRVWRRGHSKQDPRKVHAEHRAHYWPLILAVFVVVGMIVGAYFLGWHTASGPVAQKVQVAKNKADRVQASATVATKHYDSSIYTLGFDYPNNWVISDTKDKLTLTSPSFTMVDSQKGSTDNGHVIMTIQNQQPNIPGFPENGATASLPSTQLTYKHPTENVQRKQSYLSYLGYTGSDGIDALYLTGDNVYQGGDNVPMSDIVQGNPLISVAFAKCTKSFCMGGTTTPLTLKSESWNNASFKQTVINILQSLGLH